MVELSISEKLSTLFDIILPSPFFLSLLAVAILTIILLIVNVKIKNKLVKNLIAASYSSVIIYIFIQYGGSVLELSDNLVDKVFNAVYFPNLVTYICMLLIAVLLFIRSMIDKNMQKLVKYSSIFSFVIIVFLFILVLDTIVSSGINIADKTAVYTNQALVVLIQSSTAIFTIWCIILVIDLVVSIIIDSKSNKEVIPDKTVNKIKIDVLEESQIEKKLHELDQLTEQNDDFKLLTEESFDESFNKYNKKKTYKEYLKIIGHNKTESKIKY